jgi:hypothetical protein
VKLYLVRCVDGNPVSISPDRVSVIAANDEDSAKKIFEYEVEGLIDGDRREWSLLSESASPEVKEGIIVDALRY